MLPAGGEIATDHSFPRELRQTFPHLFFWLSRRRLASTVFGGCFLLLHHSPKSTASSGYQ